MLRTSPGSHSAETSNGRQQTSQSVVKRCEATLVSMTRSKLWPQNGHWMVSLACMVWNNYTPPGQGGQWQSLSGTAQFAVAIRPHCR